MFERFLKDAPGAPKYLRAIKALIRSFRAHGIGYIGGQIAYFFILSLFPFLIFINALIASFDIPSATVVHFLDPFFPEQIVSFIAKYIEYINTTSSISLLSFGIILAIFSASKSVRSLANAFNHAYGVPFRRGFFSQLLFSMLYILIFGVVVLICVILVAFGNEVVSDLLQRINVSFAFLDLMTVWRWVTLSAILFLIISLVYKLLPDKKIKYIDALPGTVFSLVGFLVLTVLFSAYVNRFMLSPALYGSIGAIILLMLWTYFMGVILVLGAELNNILEKLKYGSPLTPQQNTPRP